MKLKRGGYEFNVENTAVTSWWGFWKLWEDGNWEAETLEAVDEVVPEGGLLLDIGAWVGPIAIWAARRARVIAIEPDPVAFELLEKNTAGMNVRCINAAAAPKGGTLQLHSVGEWGHSYSSLIPPEATGKAPSGEVVEVPAISVVPLLKGVDLVKCDIEGGESLLLPKLGPVLRRRKIPLLLSYHPHWYEDPTALYAEMEHWAQAPRGKDTFLCTA